MKKFISLFVVSLAIFGVVILIGSCNKNKQYDLITPPPLAHFIGAKSQTYIMNSATTPKYTITIGTTDVSSSDRTVTYQITSPTNAVAGTHYTVTPSGTVTIPANQTTATIDVQGIFSQYTTGRKDTLVFTLASPSVTPAKFSDTIRLAIKGPCFDGDISATGTPISVLNGAFANTREPSIGYGPYTTTIAGLAQPATGTTRAGTINNLYDYFGPLNLTFDWTNPNAVKVDIPLQQTNQNYAAGQPFMVRTSPGQTNTFSVCNQTLTLTIDVIVNNYPTVGSAAYYDQNYRITIAR